MSIVYYERPRIELQPPLDGEEVHFDPIIPRGTPSVEIVMSIKLSPMHYLHPFKTDEAVGATHGIRDALFSKGYRFVSHETTPDGIVTRAWE